MGVMNEWKRSQIEDAEKAVEKCRAEEKALRDHEGKLAYFLIPSVLVAIAAWWFDYNAVANAIGAGWLYLIFVYGLHLRGQQHVAELETQIQRLWLELAKREN